MTGATLIRLTGITAHYRDPRYNTGKIGRTVSLPIRTLHCPPPCTLHAMLCATKGGWVEPERLLIGWRMEFDALCSDFQTCRVPQGDQYNFARGIQKVDIRPHLREFLAFPRLTILAIRGVDPAWFRRPVNPLCLGRSEDLVIEKEVMTDVSWQPLREATIDSQCLPLFIGFGTLYSAPLYFERNRHPVGMSPKMDVRTEQQIRDENENPRLARVMDTGESFFLWDYGHVAGKE